MTMRKTGWGVTPGQLRRALCLRRRQAVAWSCAGVLCATLGLPLIAFGQGTGMMDAPGLRAGAVAGIASSAPTETGPDPWSAAPGTYEVQAPGPGWSAAADIDARLAERLDQAFEALSQTQDLPAAQFVLSSMADPRVPVAKWRAFFGERVGAARFTARLAEFWDYALGAAGDARDRVATLSIACAAQAAGEALAALRVAMPAAAGSSENSTATEGTAGGDSSDDLNGAGAWDAPESVGIPSREAGEAARQALVWLARARAVAPPDAGEVAISAFREGLRGRFPEILPMHGASPVTDPQNAWIGMQACLSLASYVGTSPANRTALTQLLGISQTAASFWETRGGFVFDNNALSATQFEIFSSLTANIPPGLADVSAYLLLSQPQPRGTPPLGLSAAGQLVALPATPAEQTAPLAEFSVLGAAATGEGPMVSLFGAQAAQEIVRAIQAAQLPKRPELRAQRDRILATASVARERYLRQGVEPLAYLNAPDDFLPALGFLWFSATPRAFRMALDLYRGGAVEPMESFLLMADLLAGPNGRTAPMFEMGPDGRVNRTDATIDRATSGAPDVASEGEAIVASPQSGSIVALNTPDGTYRFEWSAQGRLTRVIPPQ